MTTTGRKEEDSSGTSKTRRDRESVRLWEGDIGVGEWVMVGQKTKSRLKGEEGENGVKGLVGG